MKSANLTIWHERLEDLRSRRPSLARDLELSDLLDEEFDGDDDRNVDQLFLSFTSEIDSSVLQSAENAFGRVGFRAYFSGLGRCFAAMAAINPKIATERINYPCRELDALEMKEGFSIFASSLGSDELLALMRSTIVEWRLLGNEPYRTFFSLSQSLEG